MSKGHNWHFSEREPSGNKYLKKCLMSLVITKSKKQSQNEIYITSSRLTKVRKPHYAKRWGGDGEPETMISKVLKGNLAGQSETGHRCTLAPSHLLSNAREPHWDTCTRM